MPLDAAAAVTEFHKAFNLPMRQLPSANVDESLARPRVALLEEEVGEFVTASGKGDLGAIADALADIVNAVYGTALAYGIGIVAPGECLHHRALSPRTGTPVPLPGHIAWIPARCSSRRR